MKIFLSKPSVTEGTEAGQEDTEERYFSVSSAWSAVIHRIKTLFSCELPQATELNRSKRREQRVARVRTLRSLRCLLFKRIGDSVWSRPSRQARGSEPAEGLRRTRSSVSRSLGLGLRPHCEIFGLAVAALSFTLAGCQSYPPPKRGAVPIAPVAAFALTQAAPTEALDPVLLQAREVGAALVDEAIERAADLLVLSLPYRKRFGGDFAIGRTIPYVLKNAPCAVWVVREPIAEETA